MLLFQNGISLLNIYSKKCKYRLIHTYRNAQIRHKRWSTTRVWQAGST